MSQGLISVSSRATRRLHIDVSGDRAKAFLSHVVDHVQDAKPPAVRQLVVAKSTNQRALALASTRMGPVNLWRACVRAVCAP